MLYLLSNQREELIMKNEINTLLAEIKADFVRFATRNGKEQLSGYFADKVANYDDILEVKYGKKYIKIISDRSVWVSLSTPTMIRSFAKVTFLKLLAGMLLLVTQHVAMFLTAATQFSGLAHFI